LEKKKLAAKDVIAAAQPVIQTDLADADPYISAWSHRGLPPGTGGGTGGRENHRPPVTPGPPPGQ